jgi:hypothetical protein
VRVRRKARRRGRMRRDVRWKMNDGGSKITEGG